MPREKTDYRPNLERLNDLFPEREMLNISEAMRVMGYRDYRTAKKHIPFVNNLVSKSTLARLMS